MRNFAVVILAGLLWALGAQDLGAYPLSLEQRERLKRFIPRSFLKLEARDPVHAVILGDDVMGGYTPLPSAWENNNPLYSYAGVFLAQLAREFFYPGSVRLLNPPEGGTAKLTDYLGDEISFENLTRVDGTILDGLRHATSDAFLHDPDLVLVQFGVYDAFGFVSIDTYKQALRGIIAAAAEAKSDIIVFGPGLVNYGGGAMEWGVDRPYSTAAREVCSESGVLFIDLGFHLSRFGGGVDPATHPAAAMEIVGDRLSRIFNFGPELSARERVHPSLKTHQFLGESAFNDLMNGPPVMDISYTAVANYDSAGMVGISIVLRNQTDDTKNGSIGALALGASMLPTESAQRFTIAPRGATQVSFRYQRHVVGKGRDGADLFFPMEPGDEFGRFSFFLEDTVRSQVVDVPVRVGPVSAIWNSRQFVNVSDRMRIEWDLVSGTDKPISGNFQVGMADRIGEPTTFSVSPLGSKRVFSEFEFESPEGVSLFQQDLWIQLDVGGKVVRFSREMEASRDLILGEEMQMKSWADYANDAPAIEGAAKKRSSRAVKARFDADAEALYVIATLEGIELPDLGDRAALQARLFLDARPAGEVRTFGAVESVEIYTKGSDGPGYTPEIRLGSFGNGYDMILSPQGITSVLKTDPSGARLLEIRVPRSFLHRHEWRLDSPESILGVRLEVTPADPSPNAPVPFPMVNRFETNSPTFAYEGRMVQGFHENDARSLITLRLSRQPVKSWSVRVY